MRLSEKIRPTQRIFAKLFIVILSFRLNATHELGLAKRSIVMGLGSENRLCDTIPIA